MTTTTSRAKEVDRFLDSLFADGDAVMDEVLARSDRAGLPQIAVSPMLGVLLNILVAATGSKRVLEIGALGGYSTIWLARALPEGGRVTTLDIDPKSVGAVRANAALAGLSGKIEVVEGPAAGSLQKMIEKGAPPFDFIFIDADKESYPRYLDFSLRLSRPGTLIVADNVVREGEVANEGTTNALAKAIRQFLEQARRAPRLKTTVIQTVGAKGYDGFSLSLVL